jgi:hypothetical protein
MVHKLIANKLMARMLMAQGEMAHCEMAHYRRVDNEAQASSLKAFLRAIGT